jgi:hypothetical protein
MIPRRAIIPTAKLTDASNSSKPALKSHQAAADAQTPQRAAEAQKAAELKAIQQAAEEVNTQDSTASAASAGPVDTSEISQSQQSQSSSQLLLPSRSQTSWNHLHHLMTTWNRSLDALREKGKQLVRDLI